MYNNIKGSLSIEDIENIYKDYENYKLESEVVEKEGTIIVLDVLGWKSKATKDTIKILAQLVANFRSKINDNYKRFNNDSMDNKVNISILSDSILISVKEDYVFKTSYIHSAFNDFILESLKHGILYRGAISYGKFFTNKTNNIFVGEAIYESIKYSELTIWSGIICTNSAAKNILNYNDIKFVRELGIVSYPNIPYKANVTTCFNNLVYLPTYQTNFEELYKNAFNIVKLNNSKDNSIRIKYENTINFLNYAYSII